MMEIGRQGERAQVRRGRTWAEEARRADRCRSRYLLCPRILLGRWLPVFTHNAFFHPFCPLSESIPFVLLHVIFLCLCLFFSFSPNASVRRRPTPPPSFCFLPADISLPFFLLSTLLSALVFPRRHSFLRVRRTTPVCTSTFCTPHPQDIPFILHSCNLDLYNLLPSTWLPGHNQTTRSGFCRATSGMSSPAPSATP